VAEPGWVTLVEALGVDAVQPLHAGGEVGLRAVDDEVVVRPHEAVRMAVPAVAVDRLREDFEEEDAVGVVQEQHLAEHGVRRDVEQAVRERGAENPRHAPTVGDGERRRGARAQPFTKS
jgi:hypothetical protein